LRFGRLKLSRVAQRLLGAPTYRIERVCGGRADIARAQDVILSGVDHQSVLSWHEAAEATWLLLKQLPIGTIAYTNGPDAGTVFDHINLFGALSTSIANVVNNEEQREAHEHQKSSADVGHADKRKHDDD
jgi:hypothetical protein